jgi:hypothetical protein
MKLFRVAEIADRIVEGVAIDRPPDAPIVREEEAAAPRDRVKIAQEREGLPRERDAVGLGRHIPLDARGPHFEVDKRDAHFALFQSPHAPIRPPSVRQGGGR